MFQQFSKGGVVNIHFSDFKCIYIDLLPDRLNGFFLKSIHLIELVDADKPSQQLAIFDDPAGKDWSYAWKWQELYRIGGIDGDG